MILQSAESYNISPHLLAAHDSTKSSYIANARSSADAVGLTEYIPKFWQQTCSGNLAGMLVVLIVAHILAKYYQRLVIGSKHLVITMSRPTGYKRSLYMRKSKAHRYANSVKRHEQALKAMITSCTHTYIGAVIERR